MNNEFPKIFKNKINSLKSRVQEEFHLSKNNEEIRGKSLSLNEVKNKINDIFKNPNFIYKADINIVLKNGENISEKIVGMDKDSIITIDGKRINIEDIKDIK